MSEGSQLNNEPNDKIHEALMMAFHQTIAVQADEPKWLAGGETVVVDNEKLMFEFVGVDQDGNAVCRRPNPERKLGDKLTGKNKYIETRVPLGKVANAELMMSFYAMYSPDEDVAVTFFDPNQ